MKILCRVRPSARPSGIGASPSCLQIPLKFAEDLQESKQDWQNKESLDQAVALVANWS